MTVRVLVEYTAREGRLDPVREAARRFAETSLDREPGLVRHEAYRIEGTRTFVHVLAFEDGLAARDHRNARHTREFTSAIADEIEGGLDARELEAVA